MKKMEMTADEMAVHFAATMAMVMRLGAELKRAGVPQHEAASTIERIAPHLEELAAQRCEALAVVGVEPAGATMEMGNDNARLQRFVEELASREAHVIGFNPRAFVAAAEKAMVAPHGLH